MHFAATPAKHRQVTCFLMLRSRAIPHPPGLCPTIRELARKCFRNVPRAESEATEEMLVAASLRTRGRKGLYRGVIILPIGIVLLSLSGVKGNVYPVIILTCGLMRILYAMTFQEGTPRKKRQAYQPAYATPVVANRLATATGGPTLPPTLNVQ